MLDRAILTSPQLGILVGLKAEADVLRTFFPQAQFEISGATKAGSQAKAELLCQNPTIQAVISCGLAAGLDPSFEAGTVFIPHHVEAWGESFPADPLLRSLLQTPDNRAVGGGSLLHVDKIISTAKEKNKLYIESGCRALDMESGYLASYAQKQAKAFAVLRVICDPCRRSLPPAATQIMEADGKIDIWAMIKSIFKDPAQIFPLIELGKDASLARRSMSDYLKYALEDRA